MEKAMIKYEFHISNLLKSEDVCRFIMNEWMYYKAVDGVGQYREYTVGQELSDEKVIVTVLYCLEDR
nr:hypothetical protein [Neobacillus sp. Marseille-Q6967]